MVQIDVFLAEDFCQFCDYFLDILQCECKMTSSMKTTKHLTIRLEEDFLKKFKTLSQTIGRRSMQGQVVILMEEWVKQQEEKQEQKE